MRVQRGVISYSRRFLSVCLLDYVCPCVCVSPLKEQFTSVGSGFQTCRPWPISL